MRMDLFGPWLVSISCTFAVTNLAAITEVIDTGNYTTKDKEFYLSTNALCFLRPGLNIEINNSLQVDDPQDPPWCRIGERLCGHPIQKYV